MAHHLTRERVEREFGVRVIDLADATGYSPSYISLILSGKREAPLHVRSAIARALSVTLDQLIPGGDHERIELGDDTEVSPRWIREMLTGDFYRDRPLEDLPYERVDAQAVQLQGREREGARTHLPEAERAPPRDGGLRHPDTHDERCPDASPVRVCHQDRGGQGGHPGMGSGQAGRS